MYKITKRKCSLIKQLRDHAALFQSELAKMLKLTQPAVSNWEQYKILPPPKTVEKLIKIAEKYNFKLSRKSLERDFFKNCDR